MSLVHCSVGQSKWHRWFCSQSMNALYCYMTKGIDTFCLKFNSTWPLQSHFKHGTHRWVWVAAASSRDSCIFHFVTVPTHSLLSFWDKEKKGCHYYCTFVVTFLREILFCFQKGQMTRQSYNSYSHINCFIHCLPRFWVIWVWSTWSRWLPVLKHSLWL